MSKITEHPNTKLATKVKEQELQIRDLTIDLAVMRDLLARTVRILARLHNEKTEKKPD